MTLLPDTYRVVSIEEIDDYFAMRGIWTGSGFELASTAAKRGAIRRWFWSHWLMRAGWGTLALLAVPPVSIVLLLGVALLASLFPAWFPAWLALVPGWPARRPGTSVFTPEVWLLLVPAVFWTAALVIRRNRCDMKITQEAAAHRVTFLDPIVAGGVIGRPEVLVYTEPDRSAEPLCIPLLEIAEDLPLNRDPDERHLVRAAAQCLLLERAYRIPVDIGLLEFRNRAVSFLMTDFARDRTEGVLEEIRRLQGRN